MKAREPIPVRGLFVVSVPWILESGSLDSASCLLRPAESIASSNFGDQAGVNSFSSVAVLEHRHLPSISEESLHEIPCLVCFDHRLSGN